MARMLVLCCVVLLWGSGSIRGVESSFVVVHPTAPMSSSSAAAPAAASRTATVWQHNGPSQGMTHRRERVVCEAEPSPQENRPRKNIKKNKGVYARPSAAIERGSGFFVPGLEGSRVRLLFGALVLILTYANNARQTNTSSGGAVMIHIPSSSEQTLLVSHVMSTFYGILLLVQGSVEWAKEQGMGLLDSTATATTNDYGTSSSSSTTSNTLDTSGAGDDNNTANTMMSQYVDANLSEELVESMAWAAATYIALTPATDVMIVSRDQVLYRLGPPDDSSSYHTNQDGSSSSSSSMLDTIHDILSESRGGRVSLPSDHVVSTTFLSSAHRRSVLLQRVVSSPSPPTTTDDDTNETKHKSLSILVGSSQLLASFTPNDLKWLGQLSTFLQTQLS